MSGVTPRSLKATAVALLAIALLIMCSAGSLAAGVYTWVWQNPLPNGLELWAVSACNSTNAWAVGAYGTIAFYDGTRLGRQANKNTNHLYDVDAVSATCVWAVGEAGTILFYNGASWATQASGTAYDLYGVSGLSATSAWAVGGKDGFKNAIILHRDVTGWHVDREDATGGYMDVHALNANAVWAVGQTPGLNVGHTMFFDGNVGGVWVERDKTKAPISVSAYDASNVWIVTWEGEVASSSDGGQTYTTRLTGSWPASVSAFSATSVWAVGWDGVIQKYNGSVWTPQTSGVTVDLYGVCALDANNVYTVGGSTYLATINGGTTWLRKTGGTTQTLRGASAINASRVWAVGDGGTVQYTSNGGQIWAPQTFPTAAQVNGVSMVSSTYGWAVGWNAALNRGEFLKYDGSWTLHSSMAGYSVNGVAAPLTNAWAVGQAGYIYYYNATTKKWSVPAQAAQTLNGVSALDTSRFWAVGQAGYICYTSNNKDWYYYASTGTTQNLRSVAPIATNNVWAVGENGTIVRYDGSTWAADPQSGVITTQHLYGVSAADATHVFAVGANGTILFYNGSTWSVEESGTTKAFYGVAAYPSVPTSAWAVGQDGTTMFADPPYIKYCYPTWGEPGQTLDVEIVGAYTNFQQGASNVSFGDGVAVVPGSVQVTDRTSLTADITIDPGASIGPRDVNVTTWDETPIPLAGGFVVGPEPEITSASPSTAAPGWTGDVRVEGKETHFDITSRATFGDGVTVNYLKEVEPGHTTANITVSPSAAEGKRDVNVTTGAEIPSPLVGGFSVSSGIPVIDGISPASGRVGATVTITGRNFGASRSPGGGNPVSLVRFNGTPATVYASWSDTRVTCEVPDGATTGPVTVETFAGVSNADRVFTVSTPVWYLAEGTTAWGFDTDIAIMNPNDSEVTARVAYMTADGRVTRPDIKLPPLSQVTLNPADEENLFGDFSTRVECVEGKTIAVDRTMTWLGEGAQAAAGHSSIGVTEPGTTWYLPEGSTAWGFECWLSIQNPNDSEAAAYVTYMVEGEGPQTFQKKIPANGRATINMANDVGAADASIKVEADRPVIPERAMYRNNRSEGHDSIGTTAPANDYYLAEGTTAWGFTTYVLIQNPNGQENTATVTCMTPDGPLALDPITMPANSRKTVRVNDAVGPTDLSIRVHGTLPLIAERAVYWDSGRGEACHDSIGMDAPHGTFFLPGGRAGEASGRYYETWTLVMNPNDAPVEIRVTYLTDDGADNVVFTDTLPASSRRTYRMSDRIKDAGAGIVVECTTPGRKVMSERSTYFGGEPGGTDGGVNTIGGCSD